MVPHVDVVDPFPAARVLCLGAEQALRHRRRNLFLTFHSRPTRAGVLGASGKTAWGYTNCCRLLLGDGWRRGWSCWSPLSTAALPLFLFCYLVYFAVASFSSWGICREVALALQEGPCFGGEEEGTGMTWLLVAVVVVVVAFVADGIIIAHDASRRRKGGLAT